MEATNNLEFSFKLDIEPSPLAIKFKGNNKTKDFIITANNTQIKVHSVILEETKYFQLFNKENLNSEEYTIKQNIDPEVLSKVII